MMPRIMARSVAFLVACFGLCGLTAISSAHEVRPAYLELREVAPGEFSVLFKTPMRGDLRLALTRIFRQNRSADADHWPRDRRRGLALLASSCARSAAWPDHPDCRPRRHHDRRFGADRIRRRYFMDRAADAATAGGRRAAAAGRLDGCGRLFPLWRQPYPARLRPSDVPVGAAAHCARPMAAVQDDYGFHRCTASRWRWRRWDLFTCHPGRSRR